MKNRRCLTALVLAGLLTFFSAISAFSQTADQVVGTVVRFTSASTSVDVTIGEDNPTVRDLLSRLPLTMVLEEYAGREKIGYFDPKLDVEGVPAPTPKTAMSSTSFRGGISAFTTTPPASAIPT